MAAKARGGKSEPESRDRVTLRLTSEVLERVERVRLAVERTNRGPPVSENALIRMALARGLDDLEREYKSK